MQGDMNAPGTFERTMEDLLHNELGKNIWVYIDDIFVELVTGQTGPRKMWARGPFPRPAPLNSVGLPAFLGIPCPCPS